MYGQCEKTEGARLLETMRQICTMTGCEDVEHATLAYEMSLQKAQNMKTEEQQSPNRI